MITSDRHNFLTLVLFSVDCVEIYVLLLLEVLSNYLDCKDNKHNKIAVVLHMCLSNLLWNLFVYKMAGKFC